jgi:hypothetical protein
LSYSVFGSTYAMMGVILTGLAVTNHIATFISWAISASASLAFFRLATPFYAGWTHEVIALGGIHLVYIA